MRPNTTDLPYLDPNLLKTIFANLNGKEEDLAKIKEYMIKQYKANQIENSYWMGLIHEYLYTGLEENNYESIVNNVTINDIKKYATEFFKNSHRIEVTMTTKEK